MIEIHAQFPEPRPFQHRAHEALREGFRAGHKNQLVMAPTGAGKSYLGLRAIYESLLKGKRCMFVCDRTTLINQTSQTADRYGLIEHGIMQADHWRGNLSLPFQIASAQTLARRGWPDADLIVIDEAHTQISSWVKHIPTCRAAVIGLSATPFSPGLGKLFSNLVNATTMHELTQSGLLVPMTVFTGVKPDMSGAKLVAGEWSDDDCAARGSEIVGDVVGEWVARASDRKTIVFGATILHCKELAAQFNAVGYMAAVFTAHTTDAERKDLLDDYRKPDSALRVLVSVEALAKGFDVPDVGCVVDCRPLRKSLSTAMQMWGRGLRSAPGKTDCILMDHSGNMLRFREDFEEIYFNGIDTLDSGDKMDKVARKEPEEQEERSCPSCGNKPFRKRCVSCGFETESLALIEHHSGQMVQLTLGDQGNKHDPSIWAQVCSHARSYGKPETAAQRAWYLYRDVMGFTAPKSYRFDPNGPNVRVEKRVYNKIRSNQIAWRKSQEKAA